MKMLLIWGSLLVAVILSGCAKPFDEELAFHYAPVHYQDTDDTDAIADFITAVDYDGDWKTSNNWDNLKNSGVNLSAKVYYSVVESCTHWFIVYGFYHPRDWRDSSFSEEHENDLEGLLAIIRKDGSDFGELEGMITVFHEHFFSYVPKGSPLIKGHEDIDGEIKFDEGTNRMKTSQEAKGHGLKAWPFAGNFDGGAGQDGIIYFPSLEDGEVPQSGNERAVNYELVSVFRGMWIFQLTDALNTALESTTFAKWGTFKGDQSGTCGAGATVDCKSNKANSPWGWDDVDDGPTFAGEMALDPSHLVDHYFDYDDGRNFSPQYVRNRYLESLEDQGFNDNLSPQGWPDQLSLSILYEKLDVQCP